MANQPISIALIMEGARQAKSLAKNLEDAAKKIRELGDGLPESPLVLHGGDYLSTKLPLLYRWSAKFPGQLEQAIEDAFAKDATAKAAETDAAAYDAGQPIDVPELPFKGDPPKRAPKKGVK